VAHGLSRAADVVPGPTLATAEQVLASLGVDDLVELGPREGGLDVRRKTCCLAFTLPEPKICSGCCIG
jgi:ferric iron reductase protein FhuF